MSAYYEWTLFEEAGFSKWNCKKFDCFKKEIKQAWKCECVCVCWLLQLCIRKDLCNYALKMKDELFLYNDQHVQ